MRNRILSLLFAVAIVCAMASCSKDNEQAVVPQQTYVLVHGAWQAPYVWEAVRADLQSKGHKVIIVELPGHGSDFTPPQNLGLDVYRDKVIAAMKQTDGKVVLVGHSMGGMVVSLVAEQVPERISKLVYIGAFLPASGQSLTDLAFTDTFSKLGACLVPSADQLTLDVVQDSLPRLFIDDGSASDKVLVLANYRAEPAIPFTHKAQLTAGHFGAVEKVYIKTMQDLVITPALQDRMIAAAQVRKVYALNTSHCPFISQPHMISGLLLEMMQ